MSTEETTVGDADVDLRNLDEARAEAEALRQELDDTKADLSRMVDQLAEANGRLIKAREQRDTWRTMHHEVEKERDRLRRPRVGEHDEPCPHDNPAPTSQGGKCVKPRGHEVHWNGRGDVWRLCIEEMIADLDRLRTAIKHVADLATQGNTVGLIAAAARLGEVLDGGT